MVRLANFIVDLQFRPKRKKSFDNDCECPGRRQTKDMPSAYICGLPLLSWDSCWGWVHSSTCYKLRAMLGHSGCLLQIHNASESAITAFAWDQSTANREPTNAVLKTRKQIQENGPSWIHTVMQQFMLLRWPFFRWKSLLLQE